MTEPAETFTLPGGTRIAHYRVESRIGVGGMGEVYKAVDSKLDRPVALKILPPQIVSDPERVRRFVQEARAASALNHPNIVTIYDIGHTHVQTPDGDAGPGVHYMAMEFIDGQTLRTMIRKSTRTELLNALVQAADGLAKSHAAGIVHRDLKPENIMVSADGYTKVVDFGLAKLVEQKSLSNQVLTQSGVMMGTVGYMSPEQVEGRDILPSSDIFSFGCILYECVSKKRPFKSDVVIDTLHKIMFSDPAPLEAVVNDAPARLQVIVDRCLKKKPSERYASIRDVASDLREFLSRPAEPAPLRTDVTVPLDAPETRAALAAAAIPPARKTGSGTTPLPALPRSSRISRPTYGDANRISVHGGVLSRVGTTILRFSLLLLAATAVYVPLTMPDVRKLKDENPKFVGDTRLDSWTSYGEIPAAAKSAAIAQDAHFERRRSIDVMKPGQALKGLFSADRQLYAPSPLARSVAHQLYGVPDWNVPGRVREWFIASALHEDLSRERIVELYLNLAPFGDAIGLHAASQHHYKKPPRRLTATEARELLKRISR